MATALPQISNTISYLIVFTCRFCFVQHSYSALHLQHCHSNDQSTWANRHYGNDSKIYRADTDQICIVQRSLFFVKQISHRRLHCLHPGVLDNSLQYRLFSSLQEDSTLFHTTTMFLSVSDTRYLNSGSMVTLLMEGPSTLTWPFLTGDGHSRTWWEPKQVISRSSKRHTWKTFEEDLNSGQENNRGSGQKGT